MSAERLGDAFDLLAAYEPDGGSFFEHRGFGLAGSPGAERVPVAEAPARLKDRGGGAIAVGALPFAGAGSLAIPAAGVRRGPAGVEPIGTGPDVRGRPAGSAPSAAFGDPQLREAPSA